MKLFKTFSAMVLASMLVVVGCGKKETPKDADAKAMDTPGASVQDGMADGMEVDPTAGEQDGVDAPPEAAADEAAADVPAADVPAADVPAADEPAADEPAADGGDEG
jgi:hypothetical protein